MHRRKTFAVSCKQRELKKIKLTEKEVKTSVNSTSWRISIIKQRSSINVGN